MAGKTWGQGREPLPRPHCHRDGRRHARTATPRTSNRRDRLSAGAVSRERSSFCILSPPLRRSIGGIVTSVTPRACRSLRTHHLTAAAGAACPCAGNSRRATGRPPAAGLIFRLAAARDHPVRVPACSGISTIGSAARSMFRTALWSALPPNTQGGSVNHAASPPSGRDTLKRSSSG